MQELTEDSRTTLARNLALIQQRIRAAHARAGRQDALPRLVAVTKKQSSEVALALAELGVEALGENRPEEIWRKDQELRRPLPWHLIGHFQRKKVVKTLPSLKMIHSVHSLELMAAIDHRLLEIDPGGGPMPILLQVNLSEEASKQGFSRADAKDAADIALAFPRLKPQGFMTMAPFSATEPELRQIFGGLRALRDEIGADRLPELSMGMSADFEIAVEEGATLVRIGSALFDGMSPGR